jgi:hypothetical protein
MEAYRQFLSLWDGAGSADRLRGEALAGVRGDMLLPDAGIQAEPSFVAQGRDTREWAGERSQSPRSWGQHPGRRRDPFPTPAWLMPSEPEKAPAGQVAQPSRPIEAEVVPEERKSPVRENAKDLE